MYGAATAATAAVAAGAFTVAGFLSVAGGMMSAMGYLSKDKDFQRVGGLLSLAGGLAGGWQSGANAGSAGSQAVADEVYAGADAAGAAGGAGGAGAAPTAGAQAAAAAPAAETAAAAEPSQLRIPGDAADLGYADAPAAAAQPAPQSLLEQAARSQSQADVQATLARGQSVAQAQAAQAGQASAVPAPITPGQTPSLWQSAKEAMGGVGGFIKSNPQASEMLFRTMAGYAQDRGQQEQFDYRRSLMERANRNANSPVRMGYYPATRPTGG